MSLPAPTIEKLAVCNEKAEGGYTNFIYYVNKDLVKPGEEPPLLGIVIPLGEFSSKRKAEEERDRICAETGAYTVVSCANNHAFPINSVPSKDAVRFNYNDSDTVEKISKSIESARRRNAEIRSRLEKEVKERENTDSLSYLINKIYISTSAKDRAEKLMKEAQEASLASKLNHKLVLEYFDKHPEAKDKWEIEAKNRLEERGEIGIYYSMVTGMKNMSSI